MTQMRYAIILTMLFCLASTSFAQDAKPATEENGIVLEAEDGMEITLDNEASNKTDDATSDQSAKTAKIKVTKKAKSENKEKVVKENIEDVVNSRITFSKVIALFDTTSQPPVVGVETLAWSSDGKHLIFDLQGNNKFYTIATCKLNSKKPQAKLIESYKINSTVKLNNSNPVYYPGNKYFAFIAQDEHNNEFKRSLPQFGLHCNLFMANASGSKTWKLTDYISTYSTHAGVVLPRFSANGKKIAWTGCTSTINSKAIWGERNLNLADIEITDRGPKISNLKTIAPFKGENCYCETCAISNDGQNLIFACNLDRQEWFGMDICTIPTGGGNIKKLTDTPTVWDHCATLSPQNKKIIWSSSEGYAVTYMGPGGAKWENEIMSELWIMNVNGTNKQRLTGYNDRNSPMYTGIRSFIGAVAWNPANSNQIAFVLHQASGLYKVDSTIIVAELANSLTMNLPADLKNKAKK